MDQIAPKPFHAIIKSGWFDPTFRLEIKRYKKGISQLYFEQDTLITGVQRLKSIYELFGETLTQLCKAHMGFKVKQFPICSSRVHDPAILGLRRWSVRSLPVGRTS